VNVSTCFAAKNVGMALYTYDVPTRSLELFLEARELSSVVYCDNRLPHEQRQYTAHCHTATTTTLRYYYYYYYYT